MDGIDLDDNPGSTWVAAKSLSLKSLSLKSELLALIFLVVSSWELLVWVVVVEGVGAC